MGTTQAIKRAELNKPPFLGAGLFSIAFKAYAATADCLILGDRIAVGTAQHLVSEDGVQ